MVRASAARGRPTRVRGGVGTSGFVAARDDHGRAALNYSLRPRTAEDEAFLRRLDAEVRGAEFARFPAMMLEPLLDMQFRAREAQYGNDYPGAQSSIVVCDGIDVGRLLVHEDGDLLHVVDIALLAEFRGKGLGTAVLTEVAGRGKVVRLQVRKENPAGRLYERLGFVCEFEDELNRHLRREV